MWVLQDRRARRSTERAEALRFQLQYTLERGHFEAIVLADDEGLIVAAAGNEGVCEELGAFAPLFTRAPLGMPMPPLLQGADVGVRPIKLLGQELFLACVGGTVARDALLSHSTEGLSRILETN